MMKLNLFQLKRLVNMNIKSKNTLKQLEKLSGKKLTLGHCLWAIRNSEEITQVDFANLLKISPQNLCDLEHGRRFASPKMATLFAKKLQRSPEHFIKLCLQDMLDRENIKLYVDVDKKKYANNNLVYA